MLDEECEAGARISLERCRHGVAPFAITCGVYGLLMHTCFFEKEELAQSTYGMMKGRLEAIASLIGEEDYIPAARAFIDAFP